MLPQVQSEEGILVRGERRVLVGEAVDDQAMTRPHQPCPPAAYVTGDNSSEPLFERRERAELLHHGVGKWPGGLATAILTQDRPEETVVRVPAPEIADRVA